MDKKSSLRLVACSLQPVLGISKTEQTLMLDLTFKIPRKNNQLWTKNQAYGLQLVVYF